MNCDHCDKPAVVHELVIKNGATVEVHLCKEHAPACGYTLPANESVGQMLAHSLKAKAKSVRSCPGCGLTFTHIRQFGTLGCPECYAAFEDGLEPLIERAQAGSSFHAGRAPDARRDPRATHAIRSRLMKELEQAIAAEEYERAAQLRDRIAGLASDCADARCAGAPDPASAPHRDSGEGCATETPSR